MERLSNSSKVTQHVSDRSQDSRPGESDSKAVLLASMLYCLSEHLPISDTRLDAKQRYNNEQAIALMLSNFTV